MPATYAAFPDQVACGEHGTGGVGIQVEQRDRAGCMSGRNDLEGILKSL